MAPPESESNVAETLSIEDLREAWNLLVHEDRLESFLALPRHEAEDLFLELPARDQAELVLSLPSQERRSWVRLSPPDDVADLIQEVDAKHREELLSLLDEPSLGRYHGGEVAAPAFARVMEGALRLMDVAPDALDVAEAASAPLNVPKPLRTRRPG